MDIKLADGTVITGVPDDMAQFGEDLNPILAGMMETRQFVLDRLPDAVKVGPLREAPAGTMESIREASPWATGIGGAAPYVAAAMMAPGTMAAQGGVGAVLEGLKAFGSGTTLKDIALQTGLAAGGQGLSNMATRVMSGAARVAKAARGGKVLTTTSQPARIVAETGLGRGKIEAVNQKNLVSRFGKILGIDDLKTLDRNALAKGADNIGKLYDDALKVKGPVDVTEAAVLLDEIPPELVPGKRALMSSLYKLADDGSNLRGTHRALRDTIAKMRKSPTSAGFADEAEAALLSLDKAAGQAGADIGALKAAGQRWKILKTADEIPDAWIGGKINPRTWANRLGRENFKGFGTSIKRGNAVQEERLLPEVSSFVDDVLALGADPRAVGRSGTAESIASTIATGGAGAGIALGDPKMLAGAAALYGVMPPLAGLASVGVPVRPVGKIASGLLQSGQGREE